MLQTFLIFMVLTGVFAEREYDCDVPLEKECPLSLKEGFPKGEEEFMAFCNSMIGHFECGLAMEEQCHRDPEAVGIVTQILPVLRDVCGDDDLLHTAILENLKCYEELIEEETGECYRLRPTEEKLQQYLTALGDEGLVDTNRNDNDTLKCLRAIHGVACSALMTEEKCGTVAMNAMIEIIRRLSVSMFESCGEEVSVFLPTVVFLYKLEDRELEDIEQALRKK